MQNKCKRIICLIVVQLILSIHGVYGADNSWFKNKELCEKMTLSAPIQINAKALINVFIESKNLPRQILRAENAQIGIKATQRLISEGFDELNFKQRKAQASLKIDINGKMRYLKESANKLIFQSQKNNLEIDLIALLINFLHEELGYIPIVSVIGSSTYKFNDKGDIDWNNIDDIDIIIYLPDKNDVICNRESELLESFYKNLAVKGFDNEHIVTQNNGITREHEVNIKFSMVRELMCNPDNPFRGAYDKYRPTDYFFGNIDLLNSVINKFTLDYILKNWITHYHLLWEEINIDPNKLSVKLLLKKLNRMKLLALMRGKEKEFNPIIDLININHKGWERDYIDLVGKLSGQNSSILKNELMHKFILFEDSAKIALFINNSKVIKISTLSPEMQTFLERSL